MFRFPLLLRPFALLKVRLSAKPATPLALVLALSLLALTLPSCDDPDAPKVTSVDPSFAPADSLITVEGINLADIKSLRFDGQLVNFNTAYNSDVALLFRVPRNIPAAEYTATIETAGGTTTFPFRVSRPAPQITSVLEETGGLGSIVTIVGSNFYDPLAVFFRSTPPDAPRADSIPAEILSAKLDTIRVRIPAAARSGYIYVLGNGGTRRSPKRFFIVDGILVSDFDGNGVRTDISEWVFRGGLNETAATALRSTDPAPTSGNFIKLSGQDRTRAGLIGSARTPTAGREALGITTPVAQTLFEFDVNNNGKKATRLIIVLRERDGSLNDFTRELAIDGDGWNHISQPLSRFTDLNGFPIDPTKIDRVQFTLFDTDKSGQPFEVNIDNITFNQIL